MTTRLTIKEIKEILDGHRGALYSQDSLEHVIYIVLDDTLERSKVKGEIHYQRDT